MKKEEIDILLKKYYEGSSTDEDEKTLKDFFSGSDLPEGYDVERAIFGYFKDPLIPAPNDDFEERIISSLGQPVLKKRTFNRIILAVSGIAAGLLIIVGSWFLFSGKQSEDTYSDPKVAYAETIRILYGVSEKMNHGAATLEPVTRMNLKQINGMDRRNLEYLDKIIEMMNISGQEQN